ncbi:MAG TPA: hypothetical protein DD977_13115, partial [Alcanivorax sp.]|nr:hypothetical protein [Alcanivorax sp.]
ICQAREMFARRLRVRVPVDDALPDTLGRTLSPYRANGNGGGTPVTLQLAHREADAAMALGDDWKVIPHQSLMDDLRGRYGDSSVTLEY